MIQDHSRRWRERRQQWRAMEGFMLQRRYR